MKTNRLTQMPRHLVPNNPQADKQMTSGSDWDSKAIEKEKKRTLYDDWYRTYRGHLKQRDEPNEKEQFRQSDAINKMLQRKRATDGRTQLRNKGAVPVRKDGTKVFEEFVKNAYKHRPAVRGEISSSKKAKDWENAYRAAQVLDQSTWIVFIKDLSSSLI